MEYYYKNVVLTDMENFWTENAPEEYPVRQYAEAKGFDQDLFAEFYHKVCNNEPLYTGHPAMGNGDKSATFFYLTDEEQTTFANFINYYNTVSEGKFWAYSDDTAGAIVNSYDKINEYWRTPRTVPEDQYSEQRTYTAPFMYDQSKPVDIPERYEPEWYYPVDDQFVDKWNLSPTSAETPFEDIPTADYASQTLQGELGYRSTYDPRPKFTITGSVENDKVPGQQGGTFNPETIRLPLGTTFTVNGDTVTFNTGDTMQAIPNSGLDIVRIDCSDLGSVIEKDSEIIAHANVVNRITFDYNIEAAIQGLTPSMSQPSALTPESVLATRTNRYTLNIAGTDYTFNRVYTDFTFPYGMFIEHFTYVPEEYALIDGAYEYIFAANGDSESFDLLHDATMTVSCAGTNVTSQPSCISGTILTGLDQENNRPQIIYGTNNTEGEDDMYILEGLDSGFDGDYYISNVIISQNLQQYLTFVGLTDNRIDFKVSLPIVGTITGTLEYDVNIDTDVPSLIDHHIYTFTITDHAVGN